MKTTPMDDAPIPSTNPDSPVQFIPPRSPRKLPFKWGALVPVLAMVMALPFLANSLKNRLLTGSRAGYPATYCTNTYGCPIPTPVCPNSYGCQPTPTGQLPPPVISTSSLPDGYSGAVYSATIDGYAAGRNSNVTIYVTGLPAGLNRGPCVVGSGSTNTTQIQCRIDGIPQVTGNFTVSADISDGRSTVNKKLPLKISLSNFVFGKTISLSGQFLTLSNVSPSAFNPTMPFTVEAWVKPSKPDFYGNIISRENGSQNSFSLGLGSTFDPSRNAYQLQYKFQIAESNLGCVMRSITETVSIPGSESSKITSWKHIAGVIQPGGKMDIFVNGVRSASHTNQLQQNCSRNLPTTLGARVFPDGQSDGNFPGEVDEVRVSSTSRYPDNFRLPPAPFGTDSNTIALYHLDGSLTDSSGRSNHAASITPIAFTNSTISISTSPTPTKTPPLLSCKNLMFKTGATVPSVFNPVPGETFSHAIQIDHNYTPNGFMVSNALNPDGRNTLQYVSNNFGCQFDPVVKLVNCNFPWSPTIGNSFRGPEIKVAVTSSALPGTIVNNGFTIRDNAALASTSCLASYVVGSVPIRVTPTPTPQPTNFKDMQAVLSKTSAWFNFLYLGPIPTSPSPYYRVHLSTLPDMSWDVYLTFAQGVKPPLVQSNPGQWDKYVCGKTLYWRVETSFGVFSPISKAVVCAPSPIPTPSPTRPPVPTATRPPTPTPKPNSAPTISTLALLPPFAGIGEIYSTSITATDKDLGDRLTMSVNSNLPNFRVTSCVNSASRATFSTAQSVTCRIQAVPNRGGVYSVSAKVDDGRGHQVSRNFSLYVVGFRLFLGPPSR